MDDDEPKVTMRETGHGGPESVPETVEERAEVMRDYLRLIAENPEDHIGAFGSDREEYAKCASLAAEMIDVVLWDPTEADELTIGTNMAMDSWEDIVQAVDDG